MDFSPQNLRLSSPASSKNNIYKQGSTIDEDYLYHRLSAILFTLQAEKEEFEERMANEKKILEQKVALHQERVKELESKNQKLEQECRQLRFNYHQRGSVVDYLKKKVAVIEKKFDSEKEEMLSVIKYLESRNCQLNEIIFDLKKKELELNQNIFNLQQKYFNLSNQLCLKSMHQQTESVKAPTVRPTERRSLCHKPISGSLTPVNANHKYRQDRVLGTNRQNNFQVNINSQTLEDSQHDSLGDSSVREKTVKIEHTINRVKSEEEIDFTHLNNCISLGGNKSAKHSDLEHLAGKGILINNYGHLSFTDYQGSVRTSGLKKNSIGIQPKMSLPNKTRYPPELNTKRMNKEVSSSHQI